MTSALTGLANATATFSVASVGITTDPKTGNVLPMTEAITVTLYLRQGGISNSDLPGVDAEIEVFEGYAVSPQALDARIKPGTTGTLTFADQGAAECQVIGSRFPYGSSGTIGSTLQQVLGDKIRIARYLQS